MSVFFVQCISLDFQLCASTNPLGRFINSIDDDISSGSGWASSKENRLYITATSSLQWTLLFDFIYFSFFLDSTFIKAHRDSCYNYGLEEKIIKHNQFIHVELAKYWRDQDQLFAQFLADFFPQKGISVSPGYSNGVESLHLPFLFILRFLF